MQFWSEDAPCAYCPGTSNTSHERTCQNANIYDENGRWIPFPYVLDAESDQLQFSFPTEN